MLLSPTRHRAKRPYAPKPPSFLTRPYRNPLPKHSNSDFDTRNSFASFISYEIPGSDKYKHLTEGWQVNALLSFHSGQPFTLYPLEILAAPTKATIART
jgi:hypothetical protein